MNKVFLSLLTLLVLAFFLTVNAEIIELGGFNTDGSALDVATSGNLCLIADSDNGMVIMDIADLENPTLVGTYHTPGTANSVAVQGEYAYLADGSGGLRIVNISDPENPSETAHYAPEGINATNVVVSGNVIVLTNTNAGIHFFRLNQPDELSLVTLIETPDEPRDLKIIDNMLYVADRMTGLLIYNISDLENPDHIGTCDTPGWASGVCVNGDYALIADDSFGIRVIDISIPEEPVEVGDYDTPGHCTDVMLDGVNVYACDGERGFRVMDITNPARPRYIGRWNTDGDCLKLAEQDGYFFVADGLLGLGICAVTPEIIANPESINFGVVDIDEQVARTLTIENPGHANLIVSEISVVGEMFTCELEEPLAIAARSDLELQVYFTPPHIGSFDGRLTIHSNVAGNEEIEVSLEGFGQGNLEPLDVYHTGGQANGVDVFQNYAIVADYDNGIVSIDFSNPEELHQIDHLATGASAWEVEMCGDVAVCAVHSEGLRTVRIEDDGSLTNLDVLNIADFATNVSIENNIAYVACERGGLEIVDISDVENLQRISGYPRGGCFFYDVAARDGYVYIADLMAGMRVVDVTDIENPREVAFIQLANYCNQIYLYNNLAFISSTDAGLHVVDISDPENPRFVNTFDTPARAEGFEIVNDIGFLADGTSGLRVLSVGNPNNIFELGVYDTEDNAFDIKLHDNLAFVADRNGGLAIFDISDFVGGMPDIQVDLLRLDFGTVGIEAEIDLPVHVSNIGDHALSINNVEVAGECFSGEFEEHYRLAPNESVDLRVTFSPDAEEEYSGNLIITSDDPDEQILRIRLTGRGLPPVYLSFPEGWSHISLNIFPSLQFYCDGDNRGADVELMLEQLRIDEEHHHVDLLKDEFGRLFAPHFGFNNIPYWNLDRGYQIKIDENVEVTWVGESIPADREIWLNANWNLIPYFPSFELGMSCPDYYALSPIIDKVLYAKDDLGNFFCTEYNFSNMPPWQPGKAYFVKLTEDTPFAYPPEQENLAGHLEHENFQPSVIPTGRNMSVLAMTDSKYEGSLIRALDVDGRIVGENIIDSEGKCGLAIWGDDYSTAEKDGLFDEEAFNLILCPKDEASRQELTISQLLSGDGLVYQTDSFVALSADILDNVPHEFALRNAYPNPFNGKVTLEYSLDRDASVNLSVYDLSGRKVTELVSETIEAGAHKIVWNADDMASGHYFVRMTSANSADVMKVTLMK